MSFDGLAFYARCYLSGCKCVTATLDKKETCSYKAKYRPDICVEMCDRCYDEYKNKKAVEVEE